jgi:WhiB family redox-sensing transcriptional regulator
MRTSISPADPGGEPVVGDWRHHAACRDEDPELFFPVVTTTKEAKGVCGRCPVMSTCLSWALETGQDFGVWGGLDEDERRALRRRAPWGVA